MRTSTKLLLLLLIAGLAPQAFAQAPGNCRTGQAISFLSVNDVQASVFNTGGLFYGGSTTSGNGYLVPKASGNSPIFASGVWVGGTVNGERRVAAARYGNYNFWPGPLDETTGRPVNPSDCAEYDRLYNVTRQQIADYESGLAPARDLADWPVELGAPVIDGDGDPTNYNLSGGDRPDIIGDQGIWWVMNDVGNEHPAGGSTAPMGIEIQALAWAFARADALGQTTFYRYRIINKGPTAIQNTYISVFSDPDLGDAGDDYVGVDTTISLGYVYNDGPEDASYGVPPAAGYDFFQGPIVDGDTLGTTAFSTFINGGPPATADPATAEQYYNYMQGLWGDGTPMTAFGQGYQTDGPVTKFIYPGDPVTESFWSELNTDGSGADSPPGDRRLVVSTGPFTLLRNDPQDIVFGVVFAQGTDYLSSISALRTADVLAQTAYDVDFQLAPPPPPPPLCNANSPNPQLRPGSGNCLEAVAFDGKATLIWGYPTSSSNYLGLFEVEDALLQGDDEVNDTTYDFEGFNIYRYPTSSFAVDQRQLVTTFDKINGVTTVIDQVGDADTGGLIPRVVARGSDSGIQYSFDLPNLTNNTDYFYGITAYSYNEESTPKVIESSATQIVVRPSRLSRGDLTQSEFGQDVDVSVINQAGQGSVSARIVDPTRVTGATYTVDFFTSTDDDGTNFVNYSITRGAYTNAAGTAVPSTVVFDGADYFAQNGRPLPQQADVAVVDGVSFSVAGPAGALESINDITPAGLFHTMINTAGTLALNSNTNPPRFIFSAQGSGSAATVISRSDWQGGASARAPIDYEFRFVENPETDGQIMLNRQWDEVDPVNATHKGYFVADAVEIVTNADGDDEFSFTNGQEIRHPNGRMPFQIWEVSPDGSERQVLGAILDDAGDLIWNPSLGQLDYGFGSDAVYDRIYVRTADYDEEVILSDPAQAYNDFFSTPTTIGRVLYVPYTGHSQMPTPGTIVRYTTTKPNLAGDQFAINTADLQVAASGIESPEEALDRIAMVPNPYMGASTYESGNLSRVVRITNLPPDAATIQIYTVAGSLVRTLRKDGPSRSLDWDLQTETGLPVASGMYLVRIEIADVGERILKFGVVNRQTQITLF